ncbi:MAG: YihY/virulence factor BrkB family protein [Candidatus Pacebacteria bacterium]|nr:YihY/virulence factor BrkB family protein [Candidatus Paceibacterota bacterium]MBP9851819.1 YihY/virulence factor BrkB family protein [Candidatus Paceibacterota bacterium]
MKHIKTTLKETFAHWSAQNPSRMGASLSYYAIFSMAPLFIILISLVGIFVNADVVESKLLYQISAMVGSDVTGYVSDIIVKNANSHGPSIVTGLVGFFVLVFGATGVFKELSYSMNKMWSIEPEKKIRRIKGIKQLFQFLKNHIPSLILIVILTTLFAASIFSSISMQFLSDNLRIIFPDAYGLIQAIEPIVSFIFVALFFGSIYRFLPKTKLPLNEIAFGASVTAVVFLIGELLIGYYFGHFVDDSSFGAAGSLISIMLWVYFSAQVFFLGAAFTFTYSKRYGYLKNKI